MCNRFGGGKGVRPEIVAATRVSALSGGRGMPWKNAAGLKKLMIL
jgi:hypothetical protein